MALFILHFVKVRIFDKVLFKVGTVVFLKTNRGWVSVSVVHFGFLVQHQKFRLDIGNELIVIAFVQISSADASFK